jgi:lysophospholipase L1-like esterase
MNALARKSLLAAVWLFFIFLLLQGAGYLYFDVLNSKQVGQYGYPNGLFSPHDELDYYYTPNFSGHFRGSAYQGIAIDINGQGFRDDPFTAKQDGYRIAALGDSVVFGAGVAKQDRFTERMESSEWGRKKRLEILNFGVNSYSFGHYLALARLNFFDLKPDLVLVGFTLNDILPMESAVPGLRYGKHKSEKYASRSKPDWLHAVQSFFGRTYAGRFVSELQARFELLSVAESDRKSYHTKWMRSIDKAWHQASERNRMFDEIRAFKKIMTTQGIPYRFILFPELNTLTYADEFSYPRAELRRFLDAEQIRYCDPYDAFAAYPGDVKDLFLAEDSVHFTPAGHKLVARQVEACLTTP